MGTPGPPPKCPSVNQSSGKTVALLSGRAFLPLGAVVSTLTSQGLSSRLPPHPHTASSPGHLLNAASSSTSTVPTCFVCVLDFQGKSLETLKLHQNSHLNDLSRPGEIAPNGAPRQLMSCLRAQLRYVIMNVSVKKKNQQNTRSKTLRAEKPTSPFPQPLCSQCRLTRTKLCFWIIPCPLASLFPNNEASETPAGACALLWLDLRGLHGSPRRASAY